MAFGPSIHLSIHPSVCPSLCWSLRPFPQRPGWLGLRSGWMAPRGDRQTNGWTSRQTNRQMDKWKIPHSKGLCPLLEPLPKNPMKCNFRRLECVMESAPGQQAFVKPNLNSLTFSKSSRHGRNSIARGPGPNLGSRPW